MLETQIIAFWSKNLFVRSSEYSDGSVHIIDFYNEVSLGQRTPSWGIATFTLHNPLPRISLALSRGAAPKRNLKNANF